MDGSSAALRRLLDKDHIIDHVHRYSYCVDHRLYDEVVELYAGGLRSKSYRPGFRTSSAFSGWARRNLGHPEAGFAASSRLNSNVLVTFEDADRASIRNSAYAWHQRSVGGTARVVGLLPRLSCAPSRGMASRATTTPGPRHRNWKVENGIAPSMVRISSPGPLSETSRHIIRSEICHYHRCAVTQGAQMSVEIPSRPLPIDSVLRTGWDQRVRSNRR